MQQTSGVSVSPTADDAGSADEAASPCERTELAIAVAGSPSGGVSAQTTVVYDVAVTNRDPSACPLRLFLFENATLPPNFAFFVNPTFSLSAPGQTVHFIASLNRHDGRYAW